MTMGFIGISIDAAVTVDDDYKTREIEVTVRGNVYLGTTPQAGDDPDVVEIKSIRSWDGQDVYSKVSKRELAMLSDMLLDEALRGRFYG